MKLLLLIPQLFKDPQGNTPPHKDNNDNDEKKPGKRGPGFFVSSICRRIKI